MISTRILSEEFAEAARTASGRAVEENLKAGIPVFYYDSNLNVYVMERPDGRRFEICLIPGQPAGENFRIVREIGKTAA